jgi:prepilin-type N-terminal cleavage/methylation domain-containing protein
MGFTLADVKMKRGFTLLELIVVVIIIGILATLAIVQYGRAIERARGAEARQILGAIRINAADIYENNDNSCAKCTATNVGIGSDYPANCTQTTNYFSYGIRPVDTRGFIAIATRCSAGGKPPVGPAGASLTLTTDFDAGTDTWTSSGIPY